MSSRNARLNAEERVTAGVLYQALLRARELVAAGQKIPADSGRKPGHCSRSRRPGGILRTRRSKTITAGGRCNTAGASDGAITDRRNPADR